MRQAIAQADLTRGTHPGLILQRYLAAHSDPPNRRALLDAAQKAAFSGSLKSIYAHAFERRAVSFSPGALHQSKRLATRGRLIVGLGSESVLETGLRLHHTYGAPIIPGSALKGLASHYCAEVWGQRQNVPAPAENIPFRRGEKYHSLLFGNTEDGGVITLHDAWILPESLSDGALLLDVMTPHHPEWQSEGAAPPTDFDSPNPISFLSVTGTFEVRLSWSGPASNEAEAWTELAMQILTDVLAEWGVGGKTSSGYGRLIPAGQGSNARQSASASAAAPAAWPMPSTLRQPHGKVEAQLLKEQTKKGGWRAMHTPSGLSGPIQNSGAVPSEMKAGDKLELIVASVTKREIAFNYPTPEEEARLQKGLAKQQKATSSGAQRGNRRR